MLINVRRLGRLVVAMAVMLSLVAACGSESAVDIAARPEERFKSFLNDYNTALNDPKIAEPGKKAEWMDRLAQYYLPEDRETVKVGFEGTLGVIPTKIENVTTEKVSEVGDAAEVRITGGQMIIGETPPLEFTEEASPFTLNGNPKLKKIDGVWYIDFVPKQ